jgi:hypothetical protein
MILSRICILFAASLLLFPAVAKAEMWKKKCTAVVERAELDHDSKLIVGVYEEPRNKVCVFTVSMPSASGVEGSMDRAAAIARDIWSDTEVTKELIEKGAVTSPLEALFFTAYMQNTPTSQNAVAYIRDKLSQRVEECLFRLAKREKLDQLDVVRCGVFDDKAFVVEVQAEDAVLTLVLPVA